MSSEVNKKPEVLEYGQFTSDPKSDGSGWASRSCSRHKQGDQKSMRNDEWRINKGHDEPSNSSLFE